MNLNRGYLPALLLACTVATPAHADPVQITSGFLRDVSLATASTFEFTGADFFAAGNTEFGTLGGTSCTPCAPGSVIGMDTDYIGLIGSGTATVAGTSYDSIGFDGQLSFRSATTTAPLSLADFTVTQPFTFSGRLLGVLDRSTIPETIAFDQLLTGHGTVNASFRLFAFEGADPFFELESIRYEFSDAAVPDPVPEPASVLLAGMGLAGLAARRRSRGRRISHRPASTL